METIKKNLRLENMLNICLFFKTSELKYAYNLYAYKKRSYGKTRVTSYESRVTSYELKA